MKLNLEITATTIPQTGAAFYTVEIYEPGKDDSRRIVSARSVSEALERIIPELVNYCEFFLPK